MSIFKDFIPADQDAGAQGNGKFMDFVPTPVVVDAPVETVEVADPLMGKNKPKLLKMAKELGITDKEALKTKETIVNAIRAKEAEVAAEVSAPEVESTEVVDAPVVASLSDAPIEDETSIIQ